MLTPFLLVRFISPFLLLASLVAGLVIFSQPSQAAATEANPSLDETQASPSLELPEPLEHLQNKGLEILNTFDLGASLKGWLVSYAGKEQLLYTTADGEFLINGVVLDAQGNDLTSQHQKQWFSQLSFAELANASYVTNTTAEAQKHIYVFFDANCPFCQQAWLALQPYVKAGLEVRWLPVAYLQPSSKSKAASLLSAPLAEQPQLLARLMQPAASLEIEAEANAEEATPAPLAMNYSQAELDQLEANAKLMHSLGLNATPAWVWQNEEGEVESFAGMLRLPRIAEITGLPPQKHPEPSLTRFR